MRTGTHVRMRARVRLFVYMSNDNVFKIVEEDEIKQDDIVIC